MEKAFSVFCSQECFKVRPKINCIIVETSIFCGHVLRILLLRIGERIKGTGVSGASVEEGNHRPVVTLHCFPPSQRVHLHVNRNRGLITSFFISQALKGGTIARGGVKDVR